MIFLKSVLIKVVLFLFYLSRSPHVDRRTTWQPVISFDSFIFLHTSTVTSQVTFIYIVLYTTEIVSKQLHLNPRGSEGGRTPDEKRRLNIEGWRVCSSGVDYTVHQAQWWLHYRTLDDWECYFHHLVEGWIPPCFHHHSTTFLPACKWPDRDPHCTWWMCITSVDLRCSSTTFSRSSC